MGKNKGQSKTSERSIETAKKRAQALQLRIAGATFERIAEVVGYASKSGAHDAVTEALKEMLREPAEEMRAVQNLRLEEIFLGIYPLARKGHLDSIDRAIKVFDRQAKLNGLDMPTKVAPTDPTGEKPYEPGKQLTDEERAARTIALYERARARSAGEPS